MKTKRKGEEMTKKELQEAKMLAYTKKAKHRSPRRLNINFLLLQISSILQIS